MCWQFTCPKGHLYETYRHRVRVKISIKFWNLHYYILDKWPFGKVTCKLVWPCEAAVSRSALMNSFIHIDIATHRFAPMTMQQMQLVMSWLQAGFYVHYILLPPPLDCSPTSNIVHSLWTVVNVRQITDAELWKSDINEPQRFLCMDLEWCLGLLNSHFSRLTWVSRYQNVSILHFIGANGDGGGE